MPHPNLKKLMKAGVVGRGHKLKEQEIAAIEKLHTDEVTALVKVAGKLGRRHVKKHMHPLSKVY